MIHSPWIRNIIPGNPANAKWAVEIEAGTILYSLVRAVKPEKIIEIGSGMGYSTLFIAQALSDNRKKINSKKNNLVNATSEYQLKSSKKGHVWSIEVNKTSLDIASKNINKASLRSYVSFILGASTDTLPILLDKINEVNFLFIDGDHSYKQCQDELNLCIPYISSSGYVVIHDAVRRRDPLRGNYYSKTPGNPLSVVDFVKEMINDKRFESLVVDTYCNGLSIHKLVNK